MHTKITTLLATLCLTGAAWGNDETPKPKPRKAKPKQANKSAAKPGERFLLWRTDMPQVGHRWRHVYNMRADLLLQYMRRRSPLRVETARLGHELEYTDEVKQVEGPIPSKVLRTYRLVHDWATGKVDKSKKQVLLTWTPEGFKHVVQGKQKLAELATQYLGYEKETKEQAMAGVFERLLPHRPVPVGHRWAIPHEASAAMAGVKLEDLDKKKTRCQGRLLSVRWGRSKRRRYMRIYFHLKLYVTKVGAFSYAEEPALLELKSSFWIPADGVRGTLKASYEGTMSGEGGTHPELPKKITAKVSGTWKGEVKREPVRQGKF